MICGAIFDADGVLLDSTEIWRELGCRFLQKRNILPSSDLSDTLFSMSMEEGASYLKSAYQLEMSETDILYELKEMIKSYYFFDVKEKLGAKHILEFLKRKNIPIAVATSSPREHIEKAFERLGIDNYISSVFTTSEAGVSKHSPLIYLEAAKLLKTSPSETLVFEDSFYALKTASDAGFVTVGVFDENGEPNRDGIRNYGNFYIESLKAFTDIWEIFLSEDDWNENSINNCRK